MQKPTNIHLSRCKFVAAKMCAFLRANKSPSFSLSKRLFACLVLGSLIACTSMNALDWMQPTQEELAATASTIDPEAGAEILYYAREIDGTLGNTAIREYKRFKIFSEKGVQQLDKIDVPHEIGERIAQVEARVIKPDGRIIKVDKKSFYDREMLKLDTASVSVRSFSFPSLEPGDIAEYQADIRGSYYFTKYTFHFADQIPVKRALFRVKTWSYTGGGQISAYYYLCHDQKIQRAKDGYYYIEMNNLPAIAIEPNMPPADDCQPWLIFYEREAGLKDQEFWKKTAFLWSSGIEEHAKRPSRLVRSTAAEITLNKNSIEEKLTAINDYCRMQILNFGQLTPKGGVDDKILHNYNRKPDDLITSRLGRSVEIQTLFIALARASGIDAHPAFCSSRSAGAFRLSLQLASQLPNNLVAVKIGNEWKYYQPSARLVDSGWLHWLTEREVVLIALNKDIEWTLAPQHPAADSVSKRVGRFLLDEDGTLTGEVRIDYYGHCLTEARGWYYLETDETIEKNIKENLESRLSGVEVMNISVPNAQDCSKPLFVTYKVRIPGYAVRTGQRLFVEPSFFTKGNKAQFVAETRVHEIYFGFPITYEDDVEITFPKSFQIEEGSAPRSMENATWGKYVPTLGLRKSAHTLLYRRHFSFSPVLMPVTAYPTVKKIFDFIHMQDAHTITLTSNQ